MLERPDANSNLIENLYDSAIPELLHINVKAQEEAARMLAEDHPDATDYLDLKLVPDFMENKNGMLVVSPRDQRKISEQVLNEFHDAMSGTKSYEIKLSETRSVNYWAYQNEDKDFMPCTVVEFHEAEGISAYIKFGTTRPAAYQKLLDEYEEQQEQQRQKLAEEPRWMEDKDGSTEHTANSQAKRRHKVAKSVTKWVSKQTNLPARPNRFE